LGALLSPTTFYAHGGMGQQRVHIEINKIETIYLEDGLEGSNCKLYINDIMFIETIFPEPVSMQRVTEMLEKMSRKLRPKKSKDKDSTVQEKAAKALGKTKDKSAAKPLIGARYDEKMEAANDVSSLLEILKSSRTIGTSIFDQDGSLDKIVEIGAPAVEPLIKALKRDEDEIARWVATEALGRIGDNRAVDPLIETLKNDVHPDVRWHTAEALGILGDEKAVEFLKDALKDEDNWVRDFAEEALKKFNLNTKSLKFLKDQQK